MDGTDWTGAKRIFQEALDKAGPERREFLTTACAGDPALRIRVDELLAAHDDAGEFLATPTIPGAAEAAEPAPAVGATIGPYTLLEVIGEGGFGVVYLAEQQHPVRRRVALKIIKLGMDTRQVIARCG